MKTMQVLYLLFFIGIVACILTSTHLLQREGFQSSEPVIAKSVEPTRLDIQGMPNAANPGQLPFGPYSQTASVGSYQYQDPSLLPTDLNQMKKLFEDIRSFLVFEGVSVSDKSDPTVQLPLTQLRSDSRKLEQEISVLKNNPGIQPSLTQQNMTDMESGLAFLQRKVRLFQTSGLVTSSVGKSSVEGFQNMNGTDSNEDDSDSKEKTKATKNDLLNLQTRIYSAILTLSASGTTDPVVVARIERLQSMYSSVSDMINKLNKGIWKPDDITVYKEDIVAILPKLDDTSSDVIDIFSQSSGRKLDPIEEQLAALVGKDNVKSVFKGIIDNGSFRVNLDLGYNLPGTKKPIYYSKNINVANPYSRNDRSNNNEYDNKKYNDNNEDNSDDNLPGMSMSPAFDIAPGMDSRAKQDGLDWKKRATSICEQVRLRGLDPLDFGCIAKGSLMSPAYSWRGHTKMICGRLGTTLDPDLPVTCGCPPTKWKGWSLSH